MNVRDTIECRQDTHGNYIDTTNCSVAIKDIMRAQKNWNRLSTDKKESLDHIATKIARILNGDPNFQDAWHDIEGYAHLVSSTL
jgi:hypothetical protein